MKTCIYAKATVILMIFFAEAKSQDYIIENILWGNKASKQMYVGVENRFIIKPENSAFIRFESKDIAARFSGDTLVIVPRRIGEQVVNISANNISKVVTLNATYLPDILPRFHWMSGEKLVKRESIPGFVEIKLFSERDTSICNLFIIEGFRIRIGNKVFDFNKNFLSTEIMEEIKASKPGEKILIQKIQLKNKVSQIKVNIETNTGYIIQ